MYAGSTSDVEEIGFSIAKGTAKYRMKGIAMNKLTRVMVMGGFGLLAALATGAGPAQAATASGVPESKPAVGQAQWLDSDEVVGYYRTPQACEMAGQFGERSGNWDDHDCSYENVGLRSGAWALRVASDDDWDRLGFGVPFRAIHAFPGQFRPVWPGEFRPGHSGQFHHDQHGHAGWHEGHGGGHDSHGGGHDSHGGGHDSHGGGHDSHGGGH